MEANDLPQNSQTLTELQLLFSFKGWRNLKRNFQTGRSIFKKMNQIPFPQHTYYFTLKKKTGIVIWFGFLRMGPIENNF